MRSKADIRREFKERKQVAGVFQIKNLHNGKVFLGSSLNLEGIWNSQSFQLKLGGHRNAALQTDWNRDGAEAFVFEILESFAHSEVDSPEQELKIYEALWLEQSQALGERGYNQNARIRQA